MGDNDLYKLLTGQPMTRWFQLVPMKDQTTIKKVIFNGPATIIFWADGDKTVVKCHESDTYDKRLGFMYACTKRICELGGFCKKSKTNQKPFDNWMDAWIDRKAENRNSKFSEFKSELTHAWDSDK